MAAVKVQKGKQMSNTFVKPQIRKYHTMKRIDSNKIVNNKNKSVHLNNRNVRYYF